MFTGIIEETGIVRAISAGAQSIRLTIAARVVMEDAREGDSICTDGVCLTVTTLGKDFFTADVMPETMRRTAFSRLKQGSRVNLERSVRLSDRLGGHLVSGHIDGTGTIIARHDEDNAVWYTIRAGQNILKYMVEKGSVAINGISLTVTDVSPDLFRISVIPHTNAMTTLPEKRTGDIVNIECDIMAKYAEKLLNQKSSGSKIDLEFLARNDF